MKRVEYIFDEFENVVVGTSGGKDSTVIFHLCMDVATRLERLPLKAMFVDQEAEWESTITQMRTIMYRDDVEPYWLQCPLRLFNATSYEDEWLNCWGEGEKWLREKEPIALTENIYGTDRFKAMFGAFMDATFPDGDCALVGGMRAEENPARKLGLTGHAAYKWVTWSKNVSRQKKHPHITFYPIYDWSYIDVWKAIHEHNWPYSTLYDMQYRMGRRISDMRVSNLHHETALDKLFYVQEIEPETYNRLTERLCGVDCAAKLGYDDYFPKKLPFMFASWKEYRDYLLEKRITDEDHKKRFKRLFAAQDRDYAITDRELGLNESEKAHKMHVGAILTNDFEGTKLGNFAAAHGSQRKREIISEYKKKEAQKDAETES